MWIFLSSVTTCVSLHVLHIFICVTVCEQRRWTGPCPSLVLCATRGRRVVLVSVVEREHISSQSSFSDTSRAFHVVFCWLTVLTLISHSWLHQSAKTEQTVVPTRLISQEPGPKLRVLQRLRLQIKNPTQTLKVRKFILFYEKVTSQKDQNLV